MTVHFLTGPLERARGVIGRYPAPGEHYVFEYDSVGYRSVHMLGVRRPLRVSWLVDGDVVREEVLRPWVGFAGHRADRVVEERP